MENFCLTALRFKVCVNAHVKAHTGKQLINDRAAVRASADSFLIVCKTAVGQCPSDSLLTRKQTGQ